jgi:hypothetical protein
MKLNFPYTSGQNFPFNKKTMEAILEDVHTLQQELCNKRIETDRYERERDKYRDRCYELKGERDYLWEDNYEILEEVIDIEKQMRAVIKKIKKTIK